MQSHGEGFASWQAVKTANWTLSPDSVVQVTDIININYLVLNTGPH